MSDYQLLVGLDIVLRNGVGSHHNGYPIPSFDELLEIIHNGENSGVEFKRDDICPEQLAKEIVNVETLPVAGTSIDALDLDRLNFYLASIIEDPELPTNQEEWIERLLGLGLMAEDGLGNKVCSIAGLVCFGIRPRRYSSCMPHGDQPVISPFI